LSEVLNHDSLLKLPLNVLVNPEAIKKQKPWDLDLVNLLETFSSIIKSSETLNLRLCGSAIVSSALIYRLKVETLFLFEKLKIRKEHVKSMEPPLFEMPFRHELYSTSLEDLILALERIIKEISAEQRKEKPKSLIEPEPLIETDDFSLHIKELLSFFKSNLLSALEEKGEIFFSDYVHGMKLLEAIQSFILLLFVAAEGLIILEQVEDDIKIKREIHCPPR
jgi:segregation and condensation protein A